MAVGPANVTARKLKPHRAIGGALVFLGVALCGMAAAQNFQTILALRILLGAGCSFIPIVNLYTSLWYKRDELATRVGKLHVSALTRVLVYTRIALFYSASSLSGAFGGMIAYGIQSDLTYEITGRHPWAWLFLIFGCVAILVGIIVVVLLPRFPDDLLARNRKHWLFTKEEIDLAAERYGCRLHLVK